MTKNVGAWDANRRVHDSILEATGCTPLVRLRRGDQGGRLLRTLPARELQTGAERLALGECELVSGVYVIQVWREAPTADGDWTRETLASEIWP